MISYRHSDLMTKVKMTNLLGKEVWFAPRAGDKAGTFGTVSEVDQDGVRTNTGAYFSWDTHKIHYIGPKNKQNNLWLVLR